MLQFALLAMQAAGMVMDWQATQNQIKLGRIGAQVEQAGINANIQMTRAQAEDASLQAMRNLRQTIGSQIAIQAARGTRTDAGSAVMVNNENLTKFNEDERARRMNLLSREAELRAQGVLSGLHQLTSETELGQKLMQRNIQNFPASSIFGGKSDSKSDSGSFGMKSA